MRSSQNGRWLINRLTHPGELVLGHSLPASGLGSEIILLTKDSADCWRDFLVSSRASLAAFQAGASQAAAEAASQAAALAAAEAASQAASLAEAAAAAAAASLAASQAEAS